METLGKSIDIIEHIPCICMYYQKFSVMAWGETMFDGNNSCF